MKKFEDKSNDEILLGIKQMELEHEALKQKMLKDYDKLLEIEKDFQISHKIITDRLKR
jgi:hypothetical protein